MQSFNFPQFISTDMLKSLFLYYIYSFHLHGITFAFNYSLLMDLTQFLYSFICYSFDFDFDFDFLFQFSLICGLQVTAPKLHYISFLFFKFEI